MSPKEKAEELREKCDGYVCYALVAVDEILSMGIMSDSGDWKMAKLYWEEVKQEIEKL
jgi:hypothetical protein